MKKVKVKVYGPNIGVGEKVEMGKYDYLKKKIVFHRLLTVKKIYKSKNFFEPDLLEFEEITGLFNKNRFYKKDTLEKIKCQ